MIPLTTEERLRQAEKRLREIQHIAHLGTWVWNLLTNEHHLSEEFYRIFARSPQDFRLPYESFLSFVHPEDYTAAQQQINAAIYTGVNYCQELRILWPNGETRYLYAQGEVKRTEKGAPLEILFYTLDITERKRVEKALRQSQQLLEKTFDSLEEAVMVVYPLTNTIVTCNPAVERVFGYSRTELLGQTAELLHLNGEAEQQFRRESLAVLETHKVFQAEYVLRRKDGTAFFSEVTVTEILDEVEFRRGMVISVRDITERKQRDHERQAIASLATALRSAQTRQEILTIVLEQVLDLLKAEGALIATKETPNTDLRFELGHGAWVRATGESFLGTNSISNTITLTGQPYLCSQIANDPQMAWLPAVVDEICVTAVGIPLTTKDKVIGVLWVGRATVFSQDEIRLITALNEMAANAIHRAVLFDELQHSHLELAEAYDTTLEGWARALDLRDSETEGHSRRVTEMTVRLAEAMGISGDDLVQIRRGALLHDIGKMGIPDGILLKPGPLNEAEWAIMRQHPAYAKDLLTPIAFLRPALDIPYEHHEKWDGTGYPRGLQGKEISLPTRIFTVVDVWDALSFDRPYRKAWPVEQVYAYLQEQTGISFDPRVVEAFFDILKPVAKRAELYSSGNG